MERPSTGLMETQVTPESLAAFPGSVGSASLFIVLSDCPVFASQTFCIHSVEYIRFLITFVAKKNSPELSCHRSQTQSESNQSATNQSSKCPAHALSGP